MNRTIVRVMDGIDGTEGFFYDETPGAVDNPNPRQFCPLRFQPDDTPFANLAAGTLQPQTVKEAGKRLYDALNQHPATSTVMALNAAIGNGDVRPIYIHLDSHAAEELPWETLCDSQQQFLALDRRWQIGRIVPDIGGIKPVVRAYDPPLRVQVVLAAAKIQQAPDEWASFHQAVVDFLSTIPAELKKIHVTALVCDQSLHDTIQALGPLPDGTPAGTELRIDVKFVASKKSLFREIQVFRPHILHFFCHGSTRNGPHLEVATLADWEAGMDGSVFIEPQELRQNIPDIDQHLWLIVLNSCQGAAGNREARSLARSLVAAGFPAVVGMRESVASADANIFSGEFYKSVFEELERAFQTNEVVVHVEWVRALYGPRHQLCSRRGVVGQPLSQAAAECKQWTLPVIYVGRENFQLRRPATNGQLSEADKEHLQSQLNVLATSSAALKGMAKVPTAALQEIEAEISRIEAVLYPR